MVARWHESQQKAGFKFLVTQIMGYQTGGPQKYATGRPPMLPAPRPPPPPRARARTSCAAAPEAPAPSPRPFAPPPRYTGRPMEEAHAHLAISPAEWRRFIVVARETFDRAHVPQPAA